MESLCFFVLIIVLSGCLPKVKPDDNSAKSITELTSFVISEKRTAIKDTLLIVDTLKRTDNIIFTYGTMLRLPEVIAEKADFSEQNRKIINDFSEAINAAQNNGHADKNKFRKIDYQVYVSDSIVSIVVEETKAYYLSEGNTRYEVYHFNSNSNQLVDANGLFEAFGLSQVPVLNAFAEQCTMPPDHTEPLFDMNWFERVKWKNINDLKLFMDNDKNLIIIYPVSENGVEATQKLASF